MGETSQMCMMVISAYEIVTAETTHLGVLFPVDPGRLGYVRVRCATPAGAAMP
jgi:hypothetical protein